VRETGRPSRHSLWREFERDLDGRLMLVVSQREETSSQFKPGRIE
jgi:hypothetical protein